MKNVHDFARLKGVGRKISLVTAYDAWSARLVAQSRVDAILVGDSAAMVMHGHSTTLGATVAVMATHTRAVARTAGDKFIIADLPFLSYRKGKADAVRAVGTLVRSGAQAVKLEGVDGHEDVIAHIIESGVPVMGHIGLTPQSVNRLGGYRVQGRTPDAAADLVRQARTLERLGCFAVVLECVPAETAARITEQLHVPTIGIGAGNETDGQILVLHDLLGFSAVSAKFVRQYFDGARAVTDALNAFDEDVKAVRFPSLEESYQ